MEIELVEEEKMFINKIKVKLAKALVYRTSYKVEKRSYFNEKLDFLLKKDNFFFIQVGAHDGVRFDTLYEKITPYNIQGIVIEPIKKYFKRLSINYEEYNRVIPLNLALHPTETEVDLYYVDTDKLHQLPKWSAGIGSFHIKHHNKINIPDKFIIKEKVACKSFMDIIYENNVSKIDLLQIDTEGFDFEILNMVDYKIIKPLLIKYEYVNLDEASQIKSIEILNEYGYAVYIENEDAIGILNDNS